MTPRPLPPFPSDALLAEDGNPYFLGSAYGPRDAAAHKRLMDWLTKATPEEVFQSAVKAGIYNPDGSLAPTYAEKEQSAA